MLILSCYTECILSPHPPAPPQRGSREKTIHLSAIPAQMVRIIKRSEIASNFGSNCGDNHEWFDELSNKDALTD